VRDLVADDLDRVEQAAEEGVLRGWDWGGGFGHEVRLLRATPGQ
jgi:hypothetical protein